MRKVVRGAVHLLRRKRGGGEGRKGSRRRKRGAGGIARPLMSLLIRIRVQNLILMTRAAGRRGGIAGGDEVN
jgi:hypothetical protein